VRGNRLRWGALGWVLTLQFFVVEAIVQFRYTGPYSRADNTISDLGASVSPAHSAMNASFVVQAALILVGVALLLPAFGGVSARLAQALLALCAIGVLMVGVWPEGTASALHTTGAVLYLAGGASGLLALAYAVRSRSEALGTALAVLGLVGAAATIFFADGVTEYLGRGGTERVAAYVIPVGLALAGAGLWWMSRATGALPETAVGPSRRELRAEARAEQAERIRERDAALEEAARRREEAQPAADPGPADDEVDEVDPEDPWAAPTRRDR
jgi:hypothetical membrane protein